MAKIKISESELKQIIRESVENVLNEMDEGAWGDLKQAGKNWLKAGGNAVTNAVRGGLRAGKAGAQDVGAAAGNAIDSAGNAIGRAARNIGTGVGNAARTAGAAVRNAGDSVQSGLRQAGQFAKNVAAAGASGQGTGVSAKSAGEADRAQIAARKARVAQANAAARERTAQANTTANANMAGRAGGRIAKVNNTLGQMRNNFQQAGQNWNNFVNEDNKQ